jgi:N-acetylglutamate synthase-like GNAT family acetyltransferase
MTEDWRLATTMIRQFKVEDASPCCDLIRACVQEDTSLPESVRARILASETPQSVIERASLYYVAVYEWERRIIGLAGLDLNEVRLLFVSPARRRAGIGRALIEHLKAMVPGAFFTDIFVYASTQSVEFYKSCGFIKRGPVEVDVGKGKLDTVFMTFLIRKI